MNPTCSHGEPTLACSLCLVEVCEERAALASRVLALETFLHDLSDRAWIKGDAELNERIKAFLKRGEAGQKGGE